MGVALLLVLGLFFVGIGPLGLKNKGEIGVWGGPAEVAGAVSQGDSERDITFISTIPLVTGPDVQVDTIESNPSEDLLGQGSIRSQSSPFGPGIPGSLLIYKVQRGDTMGTIAANFGISVETLTGSNPGVKQLKVGQELNILPVSGFIYKNSPTAEPALANSLNHVKKEPAPANLPNLKGYFVRPTTGFNWGVLHAHNGVDIANVCGTDVVASAEGLVSSADGEGWNGGYGSYVLIEHPNGTKTRYAHLSKVLVSVGDYVNQSQKIGLMGSTGESTGCHLHFEVEGARNFMTK
jgi:LysM repeat protein